MMSAGSVCSQIFDNLHIIGVNQLNQPVRPFQLTPLDLPYSHLEAHLQVVDKEQRTVVAIDMALPVGSWKMWSQW